MWGNMYFTNSMKEVNNLLLDDRFLVVALDDDESKYKNINPETGKGELHKNLKLMSIILPKVNSVFLYNEKDYNDAYASYSNYLIGVFQAKNEEEYVNFQEEYSLLMRALSAIFLIMYTGRNIVFYSPADNKMTNDFIKECLFSYFNIVYGIEIGTTFNIVTNMYTVSDEYAKDRFLYDPATKARVVDLIYLYNDNFPFDKYCLEFPIDFATPNIFVLEKISVKSNITPSVIARNTGLPIEEAGKQVPARIVYFIKGIRDDLLANTYGSDVNGKVMPIIFFDTKNNSEVKQS